MFLVYCDGKVSILGYEIMEYWLWFIYLKLSLVEF